MGTPSLRKINVWGPSEPDEPQKQIEGRANKADGGETSPVKRHSVSAFSVEKEIMKTYRA